VINLKPPVLFGTMPMGEHLKLDMGLVKNGSAMRPQYISFMTFSQAISGF
jgi:hypothetical protein